MSYEFFSYFIRTNLVDIAPQYGSVVSGISCTFASLPGIISPTITGFIVQNNVCIQTINLIIFNILLHLSFFFFI